MWERTSRRFFLAGNSNNAKLFKQGAHSVFDPLVSAGKLTIAKEYDTPDWSPDQAQNEMQQALTALGNKVDGVYAANDGTGGGAIAAMKAAIASALSIRPEQIGIKATTNEHLGFIGREEGIAAMAVASVDLPPSA